MLTLRSSAGLGVLWLVSCATPPPPVEVKNIDFKAELARQGEWIVVAPYGRVWHPNTAITGENFAPYVTGGGWVRGPDGWNFESTYKFGKFVFHYGRWFVGDGLGWLWWPDQTRGVAFVEWKSGDGYVGWSPIPPPPVPGQRAPPVAWFFTKTKYLSARDATTFQLKADELAKAQAAAQPIAATGPNPEEVAAVGGLNRDVELPVAPVVEPPPPEVEVAPEPEPEPAPPPKKGKKPKKRK